MFEKTPPSQLEPQVPERTQSLPVSIAAREGEQMWKPEYQAVNRTCRCTAMRAPRPFIFGAITTCSARTWCVCEGVSA